MLCVCVNSQKELLSVIRPLFASSSRHDIVRFITVEMRYSRKRGTSTGPNSKPVCWGVRNVFKYDRRRSVCRKSVEDVRKLNETSSAARPSPQFERGSLQLDSLLRCTCHMPSGASCRHCPAPSAHLLIGIRHAVRWGQRVTAGPSSSYMSVCLSVRMSVTAPWTRTCRRQVNSLVFSASEVAHLSERQSAPISCRRTWQTKLIANVTRRRCQMAPDASTPGGSTATTSELQQQQQLET